MYFYSQKNTQYSQAQGAGVSLQIGSRIWGFLPQAWKRNGPIWGPYAARLLAPDYNCGMRTIFELRVIRFRFVWMSRGDAVPGHYRWAEVGPHFYMLPKRPVLKRVA